KFFRAIDPDAVEASGSVIYSGAPDATDSRTASGVAIVVSPAPERKQPSPLRIAAPDFPTDPAINNAWPYVPLCESAALTKGMAANSSGPVTRRFSLPICSTRACGEPICRTCSLPQRAASGETSCPTFGAVNVTVTCACKTGPSAAGPSEGSPEGVSTARIKAGEAALALCER